MAHTTSRAGKVAARSGVASIADAWRVYLSRGVRALRASDLAAATRELERARALAPNEPAVLRALGRALVARGEYERAAELLAQALSGQPRSAATAAALARVLGLSLGRFEEALAILDRTESYEPAMLLALVRGELLLEQDELDAAEAAFRRALQRRGCSAARTGLARVLNAKGLRLSDTGDAGAAAEAFSQAAKLDERWSAPCVNLGVIQARSGKPGRAIAAFRLALRRDPNNPAAYFNLASVQHTQGRLEEAIRAAERLLQICPDYPHARLSLANALVDSGEYDRAIALLLAELAEDGQAVGVWSSLGLAYICAGNVDRGEECLHRALAIDADHFSAYYNLALLYATQDRRAEAEDVLRKAFRLDPARTRRTLRRRRPSRLDKASVRESC